MSFCELTGKLLQLEHSVPLDSGSVADPLGSRLKASGT